eukprot:m.166681 g.166681  ORF g.166681 m.166681 type:complete len:442 (+) comp31437_c0_seq1:138-1463(+)
MSLHALVIIPWLALFSTVAVAVDVDNRFVHGWGSSSDMTFADFNAPTLLTEAQLDFVSSKYRIVSLEKCTGVGSHIGTEEAIYTTAQALKKKDPTTVVLFYLATDQQGISCYSAGTTWAQHPEWYLKLDNGSVAKPKNPVMDCTNADARAWWLSIPLGIDGNKTFNGVPVSHLIDGILADSAGFSDFVGISVARQEALEDAKFAMIAELQAQFTKVNGGIVMANGISMYGKPNTDPRYPNQHNLRVLNYTNAIMNEHTAVFECVNSNNASFNVDTVSRDLDAMVAAAKMAGGTKTVFVQTWPGLYAATGFTPTKSGPARVYPPASAGGEPTPQNNNEWRHALREHFGFAHALFLSIAEPNMFWMYAGYWYPSGTGYIACPEDLESCPAPPEWYPDLDKPLGAPLGDRVMVSPYVWTRRFEHATVHLNLNMPNASGVTFTTV